MIGWESDHATVGPIATAAKQSLLRLIPHNMPTDGDQTALYRLVLEHGDFGIHNMSINMDANGQPLVTSLYDWETGCITPAILSDPLMAVWVDLVPGESVAPSFIRVPDDATPDDRVEYMTWPRQYFNVRFPKYWGFFWPINRDVTMCLRIGSLQSGARLRTCNPGRKRCTPSLVCAARLAR